MAGKDTLAVLAAELGSALRPLRDALASPESFKAFMRRLGWEVADIPAPIENLAGALTSLDVNLDVVVSEEGVSVSAVGQLTNAIQAVSDGIEAIRTASPAAFPASLNADGFPAKFPQQVIHYLLVEYLGEKLHGVMYALRGLGIIRKRFQPATGNRPPFTELVFSFPDVPKLLSNPFDVFANAFGWGTADLDLEALYHPFEDLLLDAGLDVQVLELDPRVAAALDGGLALPGDPIRRALIASLFERQTDTGVIGVGVGLFGLPADGPHKPGFALMPYAKGELSERVELMENSFLTLKSSFDMQGGVGIKVRPGEPIEVVVGFADPSGTPTTLKGMVSMRVEYSDPNREPLILIGSKDASRLEMRSVAGVAGLSVDAKDRPDLFVELELKDGHLHISPGGGDGFLQKILPADGFGGRVDLAVGLSSERGLYFRGSGALEISLPTHIKLGPIEMTSALISLRPSADAIRLALAGTIKAELGPLQAVVENVGIAADFKFPGKGGNLGPIDVGFKFKPPNGVGLAIDAGLIKGGGYLYFDTDKEEYAGALEFVFSGFVTLKAIGMITTRMPDGSKGFSLLIIITAEFGTGIQLGFGFTLLAVGGLIGLNRTMRLQPLMEGVRTGAIDSVMFPRDVVANAPRIISDLRAFFPPQEGTFLIGPMAKLGWGTPTLISLSLGIIIEIPGNIAILGVLRVVLPDEEAAILVLQVNFVGALEFDKKRGYFFAALFESRILFLSIEGEMGLLIAFGDDANFVVSVGGFHPRFNPPPLPFPSPRRVSIDLVHTPTQRVRVEGYFAVTTNTAQFGARAELFFGLSDFNVRGHVSFDALFQFSPFFFLIEISASFSVTVFGAGLFSVGVRMTLEGTTPWRAKGTGSISILFFDFDVDFNVTWGEKRDTTLPPIAVMPIFKAEIEKGENWRALLPAGSSLLVSLRKLPAGEAALVLHPVGVLRVSQKALPLELKLDKVGNQKPNDVNRLSLKVVSSGLARKGDVLEQFAPAQFQNLSDGDKLSRPAYGPERGGLDLSAAGPELASSRMVRRVVRYEEIIIDANFKRFARRFFGFAGGLFDFFLRGASVSRSELSQAQRKKLQPFEAKIEVQSETYTVAFQADNKAYTAEAASFASEASARDYLARQIAKDPNLVEALHVIPGYERAA